MEGSREEGLKHPFVPACEHVYLGDTVGVISLTHFIKPLFVVPDMEAGSDRDPTQGSTLSGTAGRAKSTPSSSLGKHLRPHMFVLSHMF